MYYCFKTQQDGKYLHKIFFFQNIIIKQNIRMKSYVIWEIVLKPLCVLNKSRILRDPQLCWSVLCCETEHANGTGTRHNKASDDEGPGVIRYQNSPPVNFIISIKSD